MLISHRLVFTIGFHDISLFVDTVETGEDLAIGYAPSF